MAAYGARASPKAPSQCSPGSRKKKVYVGQHLQASFPGVRTAILLGNLQFHPVTHVLHDLRKKNSLRQTFENFAFFFFRLAAQFVTAISLSLCRSQSGRFVLVLVQAKLAEIFLRL